MIHSFDVDTAKEYGINAAILLRHIAFWVQHNEMQNINFFDGMYWTYNSWKAFSTALPYMTTKQVRTALKILIDNGLIKTGHYSDKTFDRTLWYTLTEKGASISLQGRTCAPYGANTCAPGGESSYTDINTDINTDRGSARKKSNAKKLAFGEYGHVKLTQEQHDKLVDDFGVQLVARYIKEADEYLEMHGNKHYSNFALVIRKWMARDGVNANGNNIPDHIRDEGRV